MLPGREVLEPSLSHTYPNTHERIECLMEMEKDTQQQDSTIFYRDTWQAGFLPDSEAKLSRWHVHGLWF